MINQLKVEATVLTSQSTISVQFLSYFKCNFVNTFLRKNYHSLKTNLEKSFMIDDFTFQLSLSIFSFLSDTFRCCDEFLIVKYT